MTFERIKQDANSIVELGFALNNLAADKSNAEEKGDKAKVRALDIKINEVKLQIRNFLISITNSLKKQEAELNE